MEAVAEQGSTLLGSISAFCRASGIAESTFGRRAEEALKRMLDRPPAAPKAERPGNIQRNNQQRHRKKPRR